MRLTWEIARRVGAGLVSMFGVSIVVFFAIHLVPGGYQDVLLGPLGTPAARARTAAMFGLDRPLWEQYYLWATAALRGEFGTSLQSGTTVISELAHRAPATLELALLAMFIAVIVGIPLGIVAGVTSSPPIQRATRLGAAMAMSVPDFVLGSMLVYVFSTYSLILGVGGYVPIWEDWTGNLRAILLPALTLSVFGIAIIARTARDSMRGVLSEPFIAAMVSRGFSPAQIVRRHVVRNGSLPVVTILVTFFAYLLGGDVIVETLFSIPGIGQFLYTGIQNRDYTVVEAAVLLGAVIFIVLNTTADISYAILDPRIGARREAGQ